jgi:hypothetical protein
VLRAEPRRGGAERPDADRDEEGVDGGGRAAPGGGISGGRRACLRGDLGEERRVAVDDPRGGAGGADVGDLGDALPLALGAGRRDRLLVPIGVGSLGAAAARFGAQHGVRVVGVEPETAACLTASLAAGEPTVVETPGTSMAGLDCAEVSEAAWPDLLHGIHATVTVSDPEVHDAMRELAAAGLRIGDSGAAPYAALSALPERGRTVLVATEGPTDPAGYERVVGARP